MSAFLTALRDFIARDLMFLLGGSVVTASLLYAVSLLETVTSNIYVLILVGGIAYVLGWVIQDVFCIIGWVTVRPYHSPKRFYLALYKRLLGDDWEAIDQKRESLRDRKVRVYEKASQRNLIEIERFIALKQVASTISPSCRLRCLEHRLQCAIKCILLALPICFLYAKQIQLIPELKCSHEDSRHKWRGRTFIGDFP